MIIAPPLVMTHEDSDEMVHRIRRSLDDTLAGLRAEGLI
jgi:putrescine aminotransferase